MAAFLKQFKDLKIQLEEIKSATNNFNDEKNKIGGGGFGKVYAGVLSRYKEQGTARKSHLPPRILQGRGRDDPRVRVRSRGSLDRYIRSPALTWRQRLKICLDAAKGLRYLHHNDTHQRVIHRDIKTANILLDEKWNAKVSDFGLSKIGPANQQYSFIVTGAAGTPGYCDPQYMKTYTLTKESDVYSFGVVLFEVLCGTFCYKYIDGQVQDYLVPTWIESYKHDKLNEIIFKNLRMESMDVGSLKVFSDIAYQCLSASREDRPTMAKVVTELEIALKSVKIRDGKKPQIDYKEIIRTAVAPLNYRSEAELMMILSQGVLLNGGKTWFSLNKNGEHCELISIEECLPFNKTKPFLWTPSYNSRFAVGSYKNYMEFEAHVTSQFLTPLVTYTVNLVFKSERKPTGQHLALRYRLKGEAISSVSYLFGEREDGWLTVELYQFTSDQRMVDLEILIEGMSGSFFTVQLEGLEFRPLDKLEHKVLEDRKGIPDSHVKSGEDKLPSLYEDIIKWSKDSVQWTTKEELYSILCNGFLANDGQEWFSLDKNGKNCLMLSARASGIKAINQAWLSLPELRFGEALKIGFLELEIVCKIKSEVLSSATTYACYLVYKLPQDQAAFKAPMKVTDRNSGSDDWIKPGSDDWKAADFWYIYLTTPQTPVIRPKTDENTHNPMNRPNTKSLPQLRKDGWMEIQVWEFQIGTTTDIIPLTLDCSTLDNKMLDGLIVQGIEFRAL